MKLRNLTPHKICLYRVRDTVLGTDDNQYHPNTGARPFLTRLGEDLRGSGGLAGSRMRHAPHRLHAHGAGRKESRADHYGSPRAGAPGTGQGGENYRVPGVRQDLTQKSPSGGGAGRELWKKRG